MAEVAVNLENAKRAKEVARRNLELAKRLYKEGDYYDWVIVVLFYSACLLIISICYIKGDVVPHKHKGRYNKETKTYEIGMLDQSKKYLNSIAHDNYSALLVLSQLLRYDPEIILNFQNDSKSSAKLKNTFYDFKIILDDFKNRYDKYLNS